MTVPPLGTSWPEMDTSYHSTTIYPATGEVLTLGPTEIIMATSYHPNGDFTWTSQQSRAITENPMDVAADPAPWLEVDGVGAGIDGAPSIGALSSDYWFSCVRLEPPSNLSDILARGELDIFLIRFKVVVGPSQDGVAWGSLDDSGTPFRAADTVEFLEADRLEPSYTMLFDGSRGSIDWATQNIWHKPDSWTDVTYHSSFTPNKNVPRTEGPDMYLKSQENWTGFDIDAWSTNDVVAGISGPVGVHEGLEHLEEEERHPYAHAEIANLWASGNLYLGVASTVVSELAIDQVYVNLTYRALLAPYSISGRLVGEGRRFKTSRVPIW